MFRLFNYNALRFGFAPALFVAAFLLVVPVANAQQSASNQPAQAGVASTKASDSGSANAAPEMTPIFTDYRGVNIGMSAGEVRDKLDHLKEKGKHQDFFVFSDAESAQVYYDEQEKVMAVSAHFIGDDSNAPTAKAVLGEEVQAKPDGSLYELKRYPAAGYWIAYSRTAGEKPIITVTMNKM